MGHLRAPLEGLRFLSPRATLGSDCWRDQSRVDHFALQFIRRQDGLDPRGLVRLHGGESALPARCV